MNRIFVGRTSPALAALLLAVAADGQAADLVRSVRYKLSAGDLPSAEAAVEDHRAKNGTDAEALDAIGWLARGAEMFGQREKAARLVSELRRLVPGETPELLIPLGAAIEVEAKLRAASDGRGAALRFLEGELARARAVSLRSRIRKNMNRLSLEGERAPAVGSTLAVGPASPPLETLRGRPVLLYLWARGCGDCRAQAGALGRIVERYAPRGLKVLAPTRLYGTGADGKTAGPAEEREAIAAEWATFPAALASVPVPIDEETMVRYGASATPTFVLVDRSGVVRLYTPTRLSEAELSRRIEELLAEES
jgi:thiol-disulfide isomerase/thioredoxin